MPDFDPMSIDGLAQEKPGVVESSSFLEEGDGSERREKEEGKEEKGGSQGASSFSFDDLIEDFFRVFGRKTSPVPAQRVRLRYPLHEVVWRWFLRIVVVFLVFAIVTYIFFPLWLGRVFPWLKSALDRVHSWLVGVFMRENGVPDGEGRGSVFFHGDVVAGCLNSSISF